MILIILAGIKPFEKWYQARSQTLSMELVVERNKLSLANLSKAIGMPESRISRFRCMPKGRFDSVHLTIKRLPTHQLLAVIETIDALPYVRKSDRVDAS